MWNVVGDVVKNLVDAEVALVEGCTAAKAQDPFVGATKLPPPVSVLVDKFNPDGVQKLNMVVQFRWWLHSRGGAEHKW